MSVVSESITRKQLIYETSTTYCAIIMLFIHILFYLLLVCIISAISLYLNIYRASSGLRQKYRAKYRGHFKETQGQYKETGKIVGTI